MGEVFNSGSEWEQRVWYTIADGEVRELALWVTNTGWMQVSEHVLAQWAGEDYDIDPNEEGEMLWVKYEEVAAVLRERGCEEW